jgi:hypothetical protein
MSLRMFLSHNLKVVEQFDFNETMVFLCCDELKMFKVVSNARSNDDDVLSTTIETVEGAVATLPLHSCPLPSFHPSPWFHYLTSLRPPCLFIVHPSQAPVSLDN